MVNALISFDASHAVTFSFSAALVNSSSVPNSLEKSLIRTLAAIPLLFVTGIVRLTEISSRAAYAYTAVYELSDDISHLTSVRFLPYEMITPLSEPLALCSLIL